MRDTTSLLKQKFGDTSKVVVELRGGGLVPRAQSPVFRGRITNRRQDTTTR